MEGQSEGRTDRPYFIGPLWPRPGVYASKYMHEYYVLSQQQQNMYFAIILIFVNFLILLGKSWLKNTVAL